MICHKTAGLGRSRMLKRVHVAVPRLILKWGRSGVSLLSPGPFDEERMVVRWHGDAVLECNLLFSVSRLSFGLRRLF